MTNHSNGHGQPIAKRHLKLQQKNGALVPLLIEIYAPVEAENHSEYCCRYRITGLKKTIEHQSCGVDGVQAIHLCIQMIASRISALSRGGEVQIWWDEGVAFDNLELCQESTSEDASLAQSDPVLDREIRQAVSVMLAEPDAAERIFKRVRRRARRLGLIHQAMQCLDGQLAIARIRGNYRAELRLARAIAESQPSAGNLLVLAGELEKRGRLREAQKWYARAFAVLADGGTRIPAFVVRDLENRMRRSGERPMPPRSRRPRRRSA